MTIKEICNLTEKSHQTIGRWVEFAKSKMDTIKSKMDKANPNNPADFTLNETIEIIRAGGNNTLADLLFQNATNNFEQTTDNLELIKISKNILNILESQEKRINQLEKQSKQIEKIQQKTGLQIEYVPQEIPTEIPINFLGYDSNHHYVYSHAFKINMKISRRSIKNWLCEIAHIGFWVANFPLKNPRNKYSFDKDLAELWFKQMSDKVGVYNKYKQR